MVQHEYEITELMLSARPEGVRRGYQVGKYRPDAEMLYGNTVTYLERERSRKTLEKVKERIHKYDGCKSYVYWVVDSDARIKNIINACNPPANHFFTTYKQAVQSFSDQSIWQVNTQKET
jgi:hypothetical protein